MNLTFQNKAFEVEFVKKGLQNNCYKSWYFYVESIATSIFKSDNNKYQSNVIKINMTFFKETSREPQNYLKTYGATWKSHLLGAKHE